jgi:hypothetical protein
MTTSAENEGFRMLDDFVCSAIPASGVPQADFAKSGKNEGMRIVGELAFEERSGTKAEDKRCSENGSKSIPQRLSDFNLADLVPETQKWNEGSGVDLKSWLWRVGSFEHAIGYGKLFWPEFTEFDDCVFFTEGFSAECYYTYMRQAGGNKQAVEEVMNHRHILDLFSPPERQPTREQIVYLGRLLKEMWTTKLHRDFPTRRILISFSDEPCGDLVDYIITFFQDSHLP